jgi:hypothetical protein
MELVQTRGPWTGSPCFVLSHVIVGGTGAILPQKLFVFFYPYRTAIFMHFLKQIFGYTALHYAESSVKYLHDMFM